MKAMVSLVMEVVLRVWADSLQYLSGIASQQCSFHATDAPSADCVKTTADRSKPFCHGICASFLQLTYLNVASDPAPNTCPNDTMILWRSSSSSAVRSCNAKLDYTHGLQVWGWVQALQRSARADDRRAHVISMLNCSMCSASPYLRRS
jgi:hypothetical protein